MRGKGKPKICPAGIILLCMLLLSGCNGLKPPEDIAVSSLALDKDGKVTLWLVEDFTRDYYETEELKKMAEEEIAAFNQSHSSQGLTAKVESVTMTDSEDRAVVRLFFNSIDAYRAYTGTVLFYGTFDEAVRLGYRPTGVFQSVKDGNLVLAEELSGLSDKHILFTKDKICIYGPGRPQYISANAVLRGDYGVEAPDAEEYTYIILK